MTLNEIYRKAIEIGIENDPRDRETINKRLEDIKKAFDKLEEKDKKYFDHETLTNPYSDTRVFLKGDAEIQNILVGIDITPGEFAIAHLMQKPKIHAVISHHPSANSLALIHEVMDMQANILHKQGVPINVAENIVAKKQKEIERKTRSANHQQAKDAAMLLEIPFMNIHTPADNMVTTFLQELFHYGKPKTLKDTLNLLMEIEEYEEATRQGVQPHILLGKDKMTAGKIFVDMTGGTGGPKEVFKYLVNHGVNTIVGMHISEENRKEAEEHKINYILAGHIASDNLGMNLLFDEIFRRMDNPPRNIVPCSGFKRNPSRGVKKWLD